MKFVMFPSGIAFFPTLAKHDECLCLNGQGRDEEPIAAGSAALTRTGEAIVLQGRSANLGLSADTVYRDWLERHVRSGLAPQRKTYEKGGGAFFLPFTPIQQYMVRGIGGSVPAYGEEPELVTMKEVIDGFRTEIRYD